MTSNTSGKKAPGENRLEHFIPILTMSRTQFPLINVGRSLPRRRTRTATSPKRPISTNS
jgi:hypothetical protein